MRAEPTIVLTALAAVVAVTLSGCFLLPRPRQERTPEVAPDGLQEYHDQGLEWSSCESGGFECTTVTAPIDYAEPSTGDIELAVIRKPTTGRDRIGSLLINPGGPGGSGYDIVADAVDYVTDEALRGSFDIVGWDPRGVGRSAPVDCIDDRALDEYLYGVPVNPVGSDAWYEERAGDARTFAAACEARTGELLGHIDAESTARDMDLLRAVLGDKRLSYLGFSYGTVFGGQYAELFPQKVGRMVLDGATDPSLPQSTVFPAQMGGFDSAYRAFLEYCLADDACPFRGSEEDAAEQSAELFAGIDARALVADDGRQLSSPVLGTALAYPLYDEGSWDALIQMLTDLRDGSPDLAFQFADAYNGRAPDGTYDGNATEVYTAALCVDGTFSDDLAGTKETVAAIEREAPLIGTYMSYGDWVLVDTACQAWPVPPVVETGEIHAAGADPILVLGTTNDPATPYAWAEALASQLESGVLVTRNGEGHTAYGRGNDCIDRTVDAYLTAGTVPADDPLC